MFTSQRNSLDKAVVSLRNPSIADDQVYVSLSSECALSRVRRGTLSSYCSVRVKPVYSHKMVSIGWSPPTSLREISFACLCLKRSGIILMFRTQSSHDQCKVTLQLQPFLRLSDSCDLFRGSMILAITHSIP